MEDNNNEDIYDDEIADKAKKIGKDTAKKVGNKAKKETKKVLKELLKKVILLIGKKWLIIIAIIILVILLLAGFWWTIKSETFDSISKISKYSTEDGLGNIKTITSINEDDRELSIDSELFFEQVKKWFEDNSISSKAIGFNDNDYSALLTFLKAETVSSFPDLRERSKIGTPVKKDELQGTVQFKRKYSDGSEQLLEYKKYTEFRKDLAKLGVKLDDEETQEQIYFNKDEVERAYNELKTYFTLDEDYNLIIVSLTSFETKITYSSYAKEEGNADSNSYDFSIDIIKINYQSEVQKYTMPFEFPLALLMITRNPEFCVEVAKLAMIAEEDEVATAATFNPKIVVDIQDNYKTTYTKQDYGYTANFKLQDFVKYYLAMRNKDGVLVHQVNGIALDPYPIEVEKVVPAPSYKVTEDWVNTTTPQLCVSEAITWIADYTSVYSKIDEIIGPDVTNSSEGSDGGYSEVPDYHGYLANQQFNYSLPSSSNATTTTTAGLETDEKKILEMKTGKNTEISTTTTTTVFNKVSSKVDPKWERFLSLLKIEKKKEAFNLRDLRKNDTYIKYKIDDLNNNVSPENNLLNGRVALYTLLASNTKTVTFEEIMKNLIWIYTGKIKAEDSDFDFNIYEPSDFISIGGLGIYGNSIQEKVWFALKNLGYTDEQVAGAMGNIDYESGGFSASAVEGGSGAGIGLIQWSFGRRAQLEAYASSKGVSWKDEDTQVEFLVAEISGQGPASAYATRRMSGYITNEGKSHTATHSDWASATTIDEATLAFMRFFESPKDIASYSIRCQRAQKWYTQFHGMQAPMASGGTTGQLGGSAGSIVSWAEQQIGRSSFYNAHNGKSETSNGRCAAFAKSAYFEAGLGYLSGNAIDIPHPNPITYNSSGKVDCSNIPIGAFIVSSGTSAYGHVAIYVGNGYVIEAGGKTIVKQAIDGSYGRGKFLGWGC